MRGKVAKKKAVVGAPGCWFSKLTVGELGELLRAAGAPVSAPTKAELVARLRAHPVASRYAAQRRAPTLCTATGALTGGREGLSLADVQDRCRAAGLKVSGTRFELVRTLLAAERASAAPGAPLPPLPPAAPRAPPRAAPAATASLVAKLRAQIHAKKWAAGSKWKEHSIAVVCAAATLLEAEAHAKGRLAARDGSLAEATLALLSEIDAGWNFISGQGHASEYVGDLACVVADVARSLGVAMAAPTRAALRRVCVHLNGAFGSYGMNGVFADAVAACGGGEADDDA
jgi:hypothetical protein